MLKWNVRLIKDTTFIYVYGNELTLKSSHFIYFQNDICWCLTGVSSLFDGYKYGLEESVLSQQIECAVRGVRERERDEER